MGHVVISIILNFVYFFGDWFYENTDDSKLLDSSIEKGLAVGFIILGIAAFSFNLIYRGYWGARVCIIYTTVIYAMSMSFV